MRLDTRKGSVVRAEERRGRDERVLQLMIRGASYREIARRVGLRSPQSVGDIVARELRLRGGVSGVLTATGRELYIERSEALLAAHWSAALAGDHDATKVCLAVLSDQARFYGLTGSARSASLNGPVVQ